MTHPALLSNANHPASAFVGRDVGGKYRITRVLGVGGMGVVCEARHTELDKRVAIKITGRHLVRGASDAAARFRREARAASAVESEHIVHVFDVGVDPAVGVFMVMEMLVGEDLAARLDRERMLDTHTTIRLAHQLARGLGKAHGGRVVHRDIKPGNVFLAARDDGSLLVKLLDFGVSVHLDAHPGDSWDGSTANGGGSVGPIGTALYMSPEQAEGSPSVDARSDMWSVGAVLFEALAGRPPHEDRGAFHANLVAILQSDPPKLATVAPWVPAAVAKVIDDLLVRDPARRIGDCATLSSRLIAAAPHVSPDESKTAIIVTPSARDIGSTTSSEHAAIPAAMASDPTLIAPSAHLIPLGHGGPSTVSRPTRLLEMNGFATAPLPPSSSSSALVSSIPVVRPAPPTPSAVGSVWPIVMHRSALDCSSAVDVHARRPWPLVGFAFGVAMVAAFVGAIAFSHVQRGSRGALAPSHAAMPDAVQTSPSMGIGRWTPAPTDAGTIELDADPTSDPVTTMADPTPPAPTPAATHTATPVTRHTAAPPIATAPTSAAPPTATQAAPSAAPPTAAAPTSTSAPLPDAPY